MIVVVLILMLLVTVFLLDGPNEGDDGFPD